MWHGRDRPCESFRADLNVIHGSGKRELFENSSFRATKSSRFPLRPASFHTVCHVRGYESDPNSNVSWFTPLPVSISRHRCRELQRLDQAAGIAGAFPRIGKIRPVLD